MAVTMNDRLEQFFKASPNVWIDGRKLAEVAGAYAWRSRASNLRTQRGLTIENRQRRVLVYSDGIDNRDRYVTVSEYRMVPGQQMGLLAQPAGCQCASMAYPPCGWCDGPDREVM